MSMVSAHPVQQAGYTDLGSDDGSRSSLIDWISDTCSQGYTDMQSLVKCLDHRLAHREKRLRSFGGSSVG